MKKPTPGSCRLLVGGEQLTPPRVESLFAFATPRRHSEVERFSIQDGMSVLAEMIKSLVQS
jgi:hypothetical protein